MIRCRRQWVSHGPGLVLVTVFSCMLAWGCNDPWQARDAGMDANQPPDGGLHLHVDDDATVISGNRSSHPLATCSPPLFALGGQDMVWPEEGTVIGNGWLVAVGADPSGSSLFCANLNDCLWYEPFPAEDGYLFPTYSHLNFGPAGGLFVTPYGTVAESDLTNDWELHSIAALRFDRMQFVELDRFPREMHIVHVASNGRQVAYALTRGTQDTTSGAGLWLRDLETGQVRCITAQDARIASFDISSRYLVWAEVDDPYFPQKRTIFSMDLGSGTVEPIPYQPSQDEDPPDGQGEYIAISDHWAVWSLATSAEDHFLQRLIACDLETKTSHVLSDYYFQPEFSLKGNILIANTYHFVPAGDPISLFGDILALDLDTGIQRRLTRETGQYSVGTHGMDLPYLVLSHYELQNNISHRYAYVANLQALGVVDETGHLIEGDAVLPPP